MGFLCFINMATALRRSIFTLLSTTYSKTNCLIIERSYKKWVFPTLLELYRRKKKMGPQPPQHRSTFIEWNYQAELFAFGKRLGEEFRKDLLQKALTHRSYVVQEEMKQRDVGIEDPQLSLEDNHELVEIGEKLMSTYLKQHLRLGLPRFPEEGICAVHDYLMKDSTLAHVSKNIGTSDIILCSDFPVEENTLAATLKAVVGALAESSSEDRAREFVRDFVLMQLAGKDINDFWELTDPMKTLADIIKQEGRGEPEPRLIAESGKNTILAAYQVAVYSDKQFLGIGYGESVSIAVEMAAHDALKRMFCTTENMKPIPFTMDVSKATSNSVKQNATIQDWSSKKMQNVIQC